MKKVLVLLAGSLLTALAFLPANAQAREVTLEWDWPTTRCDGSALDAAEIEQAEVYVDTAPIPSVSDTDPCAATPEGEPPETPIVQTVTTDVTSVVLDLEPGATYYIRMRVQASGKWSNLSAQVERELDHSRPGIPVIIRIAG